MQHFDVVVFDVDGTLLDTSEGVLASVKYTIKEHNLPEIDEEVLKTFIGPPIQNSFSKYTDLKEIYYKSWLLHLEINTKMLIF